MLNNKIKTLVEYLVIILAAVILALNYQLFIVKNNFAPAGLNGIATMVQYKTGFSIGYMSLIINIPLCLMAYFLIDRPFAVRSLCFSVTYSLVFLWLQELGLEAFQYDAHGVDTIFPAILSGTVSGFVYGVCFMRGSSTGGTDIVSKYISMLRPSLNFFWVTFSLNVMVAIASFFVYAVHQGDGAVIYDYKPVCLCVLYSFFSSYIGSSMIKGTNIAAKFTVITSHPDEITGRILRDLRHGCTMVNAVGGFSNAKKTMLICLVNRHQIVEFQKMLSEYDSTFAFLETANEIYGNFKRIS